MPTPEMPDGRSTATRPQLHRRLPIAAAGVGGAAVLTHVVAGGALMHVVLPALLLRFGLGPAKLGGGTLVVGLVALGVLKHVGALTLGATAMKARKRTMPAGITTGITLHAARRYEPLVALLTLGRMRALRDQTVTLAGITPRDAVLDVGCGTGDLTRRASRRADSGGKIVGIDASPEMVAEARRKADRDGAGVHFQVAAVEALPFPDATFDVVLSSLMLHHLPDELKDRALVEIRRVLKPGGRLLVVDFRRPTTFRQRLALPFLIHRHAASDVQDLAPRLTAAGFVAVEGGATGYGPVGYLRARAGLA